VVDVVLAVWAFAGGSGACGIDPFAVEAFDLFRLDDAGLVLFD
jgi:hypothetical protein